MSKYDISKLSLEEKIGQLFVFGFNALEINDHAIKLIETYKVGNVILFGCNVQTPEQLFKLNKNLQTLIMSEVGIPAIISIDQEGGMVTRIKNHATFFPGAMTLAASNKLENSYLSGKLMGQELKTLGINMNLAPVLDVNNNPYNPVIGVRSFSDNQDVVSQYGLEFIRGMQENVIATAKHFPGHGDTRVDSHLALPQIDKSIDELMEVELVPFQKAIENGLHGVMSSHINFPALTEEGKPSTLSKNVLTELLRNKLGFEGLIITDCMQMKAIQKKYTTKEGSLMAIEAGANLVCVSSSEVLQISSLERVKEAVLSGELSENIIDERLSKVLEYKSAHINPDMDLEYDDIESIISNPESKNFTYQVVKDAMTLVRGKNVVSNKKTLLIASNPISTTIADETDGVHSIIEAVKAEKLDVDTLLVSIRLTDQEIKDVVKAAAQYEKVIYCSYNANVYANQQVLIRQLLQNKELYVIAMRNPYDSVFVPEINNLICMYEYTPNSIHALIDYLKGNFLPKGKLPVTI